jgi:hypothetical protein
MTNLRAVGILSMATLCLLSAGPSRADIVTYSASGVITQADNTAGLLPTALSAAVVGDTLSLNFSVNTSVAGILNGTGDVSYAASLVSADASVGSGTVGLGVDNNEIEILHNALVGGSYSTGYLLSSSGATPGNFTGTAAGLVLITTASGSKPLDIYTSTSLSNAPLAASQANAQHGIFLAFSTFLDGIYQSASSLFVGSDVKISQTSVTPVAAPEIDPASAASALSLFFGSVLVLRGRRKVNV